MEESLFVLRSKVVYKFGLYQKTWRIGALQKYYGNEEEYPKYDNYDAINVDKTADIPCDYFEYMAVPITYTDKYNPDQFEIINANDIRTNPDTPIKAHGLIKDKDAVITTQIYTKTQKRLDTNS